MQDLSTRLTTSVILESDCEFRKALTDNDVTFWIELPHVVVDLFMENDGTVEKLRDMFVEAADRFERINSRTPEEVAADEAREDAEWDALREEIRGPESRSAPESVEHPPAPPTA